MARRAVKLGASLYEQSCATSIEPFHVRTEHGHVKCKFVIVAVDGGLGLLFPELGGQLRTARLQMLSTAPAPEVHIPRPVYSRYGYDYWQQLPDKRVVLGGGRDRFKLAEWTNDNTPTDQVQQYMESVLRDTVGVTQPVERRWAASVSYSNDILPVMRQVKLGVWAIGGYNGTGNLIGSLYGRMMAQRIVTGDPPMLRVFDASLRRPTP
jgi:glycine/D-amino acid oxidase-like deaminating enzyme